MKLVNEPLPFVRKSVVRVVKPTIAMHVIVFPLAIVKTPLLVIKLAFPVPHAVAFVSFVPAAILVLLNHVLFLFIRAR